jgi:hypothetical protein
MLNYYLLNYSMLNYSVPRLYVEMTFGLFEVSMTKIVAWNYTAQNLHQL